MKHVYYLDLPTSLNPPPPPPPPPPPFPIKCGMLSLIHLSIPKLQRVRVKLCVIYYTHLYLFHAGIHNARNATKIEKSCFFRCKENTWHVESNYILQPPNYFIIIVTQFRYMNNNFTKDRCSIHTDITYVLGRHNLSLRATLDHHGSSMYSGHYTTSVNCCIKHPIARTVKLWSLKWLVTKNSPSYVVINALII